MVDGDAPTSEPFEFTTAPLSVPSSYHCACLPRKAGAAGRPDATWVTKAASCPARYSPVNHVCRAKLGAQVGCCCGAFLHGGSAERVCRPAGHQLLC